MSLEDNINNELILLKDVEELLSIRYSDVYSIGVLYSIKASICDKYQITLNDFNKYQAEMEKLKNDY